MSVLSNGIALCKRCNDGIIRVLMVNHRYTYAFYAFVCGKYNEFSDQAMIDLFDAMTIDEKVDILSLNFQQLWYRIWLGSVPHVSMFLRARNRFSDRIVADGGTRIRDLMRRSRRYATRVWEIPKGRKKGKGEGEMDCAIREFYEETGIPRSAYHITQGTYRLTFVDEGICYDTTYFIAVTGRDVVQRLNSAALEQVGEICDMRWVSAAEMSVFAPHDEAGHRRVIHFAKEILRNPFRKPARHARRRRQYVARSSS